MGQLHICINCGERYAPEAGFCICCGAALRKRINARAQIGPTERLAHTGATIRLERSLPRKAAHGQARLTHAAITITLVLVLLGGLLTTRLMNPPKPVFEHVHTCLAG